MTGIEVHIQYKFHIVLDRKRALEFLASLQSEPSPEAFRKKLSAANYQKKFGKKGPSRVRNSYVFTYRQILLLEGILLKLEVPDDI